MTKSQAGLLGGLTTYRRYGKLHMSKIGKKGAQVTWSLYKKVPYGLTEYAMVRISDNKIVAITAA